MEQKTAAFIEKHHLLEPGAVVLAGISGGPDSLALLHFLCSIREEWGFRLIALTADHGLRGTQSEDDVIYVKKLCEKWDVEYVETFLDVETYKARTGKGTQVAARELRYQFYEEKMRAFRADFLALGHHGDDQAETILMRLVRSPGMAALTGIPVKRSFAGGFLIRPLLAVSKKDIEFYCKQHRIVPRRDPSNEEDSYTRNYYRLHVMPHLKKKNPRLHQSMQRLSERAAEDEGYLNEQAEQVFDKAVSLAETERKAEVDLPSFKSVSPALQRRVFHLILRYLYFSVPSDLFFNHEKQFFDLLRSQRANVSVDLPGGLKMAKAYETIRFYFYNPAVTSYFQRLEVPGTVSLPDGSFITALVSDSPTQSSAYTQVIETTGLTFPLIVRTRKPGDKMRIKGLNGRKKLKDIFIDEKVPKPERDTWPVVTTADGQIIWLAGLKKGVIKSSGRREKFLQLHYQKNGEM